MSIREGNGVVAAAPLERLRNRGIERKGGDTCRAGRARASETALLRRNVVNDCRRHAEDRFVHAIERTESLFTDANVIARDFDVVIILQRTLDRVVNRERQDIVADDSEPSEIGQRRNGLRLS